ncbi:MAG: NUDIX hydrolase [Chloroflexota bacterium]
MRREPPPTVTLASRRGFDGRHLHLRVDDVRLPSGRESVREVLEHPGSVAIVPVTRDGLVVMMRQFHHCIGRTLLGLPAGTREPGEPAIETARRELLEETGYAADDLSPLLGYFSSPGITNERMDLFLATGCSLEGGIADPDESIVLELVPLAEVPALLAPGAGWVEDGKTLIGLLHLLRLFGDPPRLPAN